MPLIIVKKIKNYHDEQGDKRYVYLGLRKYRKDYDQDSMTSNDLYTNKDLNDLANEFVDSLFNCMGSKVKIDRLKKSLEILESDPIFKHAQIHEIINVNMNEEEKDKNRQFYKTKLSSGHGIILLTITKLVETIEEKHWFYWMNLKPIYIRRLFHRLYDVYLSC